jgi:LEA14-like dessication related protein
MKRNALIIGGIIAAVAAFYFFRIKAAKKLQVYFKDITVGNITGLKIPDIFARFRIINPTDTALDVKSVAGSIYLNGKLLTSINNLQKQTIAPNSEDIYSLKIVTPPLNLVLAIVSLIRNKKTAEITFEGVVNTSGFAIPVKESVNVDLWKK